MAALQKHIVTHTASAWGTLSIAHSCSHLIVLLCTVNQVMPAPSSTFLLG